MKIVQNPNQERERRERERGRAQNSGARNMQGHEVNNVSLRWRALQSLPNLIIFSFILCPASPLLARSLLHSTRTHKCAYPHSITMIRNHDTLLSHSTLFLLLLLHLSLSSCNSEGELLLNFKASLKNTQALADWNLSTAPCHGWKGVICEGDHVSGLQLENMDLQGVIDVETLAKLPYLRSLSFMNNGLEGPLPNFARIGALKALFLSDNKFSGRIPDGVFDGMMSLKKLYLADNKFSGQIPATLASMPKLIELELQDNEFEGGLPSFGQELKVFNASNNKLEGPIPPSLNHFHASAFNGNKDLCGPPFQQCPAKKSGSHKFPTTTIVVVAILVGAALIALLAACIVFFVCRNKTSPQTEANGTTATDVNQMERGELSSAPASAPTAPPPPPDRGSKPAGAKLTFLKDQGSKKFDMQELLRASAEVLGSSVFGSSYKAGLNGKMMVVKRFKHMNKINKQDFNEHMRRLGRMSHQNVQPIVAFYYKKEEKLLVTEFALNVSLAARLHGNRSRDHRSLDWTTRLKIVKGVAKGLLYLHNELPSLTPAHGHLKASNVLLDASFTPLLCDYGLLPIINKEQAQENMIAYKSPEFKNSGKLNKKTDVWSFGMLILEILTRKPSGLEQQGEVDLATWVQSAMDDESEEVFDHNMAGSNHSHGEMMKLLTVALSCCQADVDRRPDIKEVVDKLEEIKERDFDDDFYSSYASESDMRSSRGLYDQLCKKWIRQLNSTSYQ